MSLPVLKINSDQKNTHKKVNLLTDG